MCRTHTGSGDYSGVIAGIDLRQCLDNHRFRNRCGCADVAYRVARAQRIKSLCCDTHAYAFNPPLVGVVIILSVFALYFSANAALYSLRVAPAQQKEAVALINGLDVPYQAPEIGGITAWINSPPLTMSALRGKVVLIDFWTYSCINCLRTLRILKAGMTNIMTKVS